MINSLLIFFSFIHFTTMPTTTTPEVSTLTVKLDNFKTNGSYVYVAVYDSSKTWLKTHFLGERVIVEDGQAKVVFSDIPKGTYAISSFYDLNGNDKLDTNFFGIPKEPYAFSNQAKPFFGSPKWRDVTFKVEESNTEIYIRY